jgi:hypothetical protein
MSSNFKNNAVNVLNSSARVKLYCYYVYIF